MWTRKHLLALEDLSREEILEVLDKASSFKELAAGTGGKMPLLEGKTVLTLFFEPSTRTLTSFTLAAKRLSADVVGISKATSSAEKGETLADTARNIEAMGIDICVIRTNAAGAPLMLSRILQASVVNAGDGAHEHPTQGLLDIFTIREKLGRIEGINVGIVGDITHSRVARSNIWGLTKLGAKVVVCGPATLIPREIPSLGVEVSYDLDEVIPQVDVINILRIQLERQGRNFFPSIREYARLFGLNQERLRRARKDLLILHPGPINRGVEITPEVADGKHSAILQQVKSGLAVRMAVLSLVSLSLSEAKERREPST